MNPVLLSPANPEPEILLLGFLFMRQGLLYSSGWPWPHYVAEAELQLAVILLFQLPKCWNHKREPSCLGSHYQVIIFGTQGDTTDCP